VIRECLFYWAARAALSLNFMLGDSWAKRSAYAKIKSEFRKTPIWSLGNTSILGAAVMLSPTAISFQTAPNDPMTRITAKSDLQAFEAAYLHPFALCAIFEGLDEMAAKFPPKPATAKATADQAAEDLDASTFQPLPSDTIDSSFTAPPSMADAFATHPAPPNIDDLLHDLSFLDKNLKDIAAGFEFLSITLAHDSNAYLQMLGVQGQGAPRVEDEASPYSHIAYEIRFYRGMIAVLRVFNTLESPTAHTDEYLLALGKSPLLEIRQLHPVADSPRIFLSAFRIFYAEGAVTIQSQGPHGRNALVRVWIDGIDLRIRFRLGSITREIRITDALVREFMDQITAAVQADSIKVCAILPDLMALGAWLFHTTNRIPRARLLLDLDPSFRLTQAQDPDRPKARFRPDTGFSTFNRLLEFQSDLFFDEMPWPTMLPLGLLRAMRITLYVPAASSPTLSSDIADISEEWAELLNMGKNGHILEKALTVVPTEGKWTNPIPIPKAISTTFRAMTSIYRLTVPIAGVRLRFDYATTLAKIWASLHTPHHFSKLDYDRVQATFGEPVALSLAGLGLKTLPPGIAELDTLEELDLSDNKLAHVPAWLATLPRLRKLNLAHNRIKSLEPLYAAPWIQEIICDGNPLADFTADPASTTDINNGPKEKSRLPVDEG
jgi:hypothetical protein